MIKLELNLRELSSYLFLTYGPIWIKCILID